jgi:hypothetical protein
MHKILEKQLNLPDRLEWFELPESYIFSQFRHENVLQDDTFYFASKKSRSKNNAGYEI